MPRYDSFGALDVQYADQADRFFSKMNGRLRPDQLKEGELAMSINGRMDVDGAWQPRKGANTFGTLLTVPAQALVLPFYLYAPKTLDQCARVNTVVTCRTTAAHGFVNGTQISVAGVTGTVDPTGNRTITYIDTTHFSFVIAGATGSETYAIGTGAVGAPILSSTNNAAWGSCRFSSPINSNGQYIILALHANAVAVNLVTGASTTIAYPTGISVSSAVEMIQAFDKVFIFRPNLTALSWDGVLTGTPAFIKVGNGAYTQPTILTAANNAACTAGVVTITNTHNLAVGSEVTIIVEGTTGLVRFDKYTVASISTTVSFTFYASVDDFTATSVVLGVRQSNGRGFTFMPAPAWGVYHQRRMFVPFANTTTGTSGSETITTRNRTDEFLISDILDSDTYDILQNQFRMSGGIADYLQTIHPFTEDNAIGFNRHSIHLIMGLSGDPTLVSIKEITKEAGLVARKSVVTIGDKIYFLSDNGVYATQFQDLYNLRGAGVPLSDPIDPLIKRINQTYASRAVGIFHNNRYYLAVPLDTSPTNNAILVYNVLNEGWESIDIIATAGWDIVNMMVAAPNGINQLWVVSSNGGIHVYEDATSDQDTIFTYPGFPSAPYFINSSCITRQYTFDTPDRKKFNNFELQVESSDTNTSDADINGIFENLDSSVAINTISALNGSVLDISEDVSLRGRCGNIRSYGMQVEFAPSLGRPKLRLVRITGAPTFRALTTAI